MSDLTDCDFVVQLRPRGERGQQRISEQRWAMCLETESAAADCRPPKTQSHKWMSAEAGQHQSPGAISSVQRSVSDKRPQASETPISPATDPFDPGVALRRTLPGHVTNPTPRRPVEAPELLPQELPMSHDSSGAAGDVRPVLLLPPGNLLGYQSGSSGTPGIPSWVTDRSGSSLSAPSSAGRLHQQQQQPTIIVHQHHHHHTHNYSNCVIHLPESHRPGAI